jgi:hypothetical protein
MIFEVPAAPTSVSESRAGQRAVSTLELLKAKLKGVNPHQRVSPASKVEPLRSWPTSRLSYFRRRDNEPKIINLNHRVVSNLGLIRHSLGESIYLTTVLAVRVWTVCVAASEIDDVLLTIAINAREAMPTGGGLILETRNVELTANDGFALRRGKYVCLSICQIHSDTTSRADSIEAFTGNGFTHIYKSIKQSGGQAVIRTESDDATTLSLYLPRFGHPTSGYAGIPDQNARGQQQKVTEFNIKPCELVLRTPEPAWSDASTTICNLRNRAVMSLDRDSAVRHEYLRKRWYGWPCSGDA